MGHAALAARHAEIQLEQAVADHEILRLDRNGRNQQHDHRVGMHHAEGQQYAENGSRRPDRHGMDAGLKHIGTDRAGGHAIGKRADLDPCHAELQQTRPDASHHVIEQEALAAQLVLERAAEHPQREHIEKQVCQTRMHEHVRHELQRLEIAAPPVEQPQMTDHPVARPGRQHHLGQKEQGIEDNQVLDHRRGRIGSLKSHRLGLF